MVSLVPSVATLQGDGIFTGQSRMAFGLVTEDALLGRDYGIMVSFCEREL